MDGTGFEGGGNSTSVQQDLVHVVKIYSTWGAFAGGAFAALRKDGTVRTWGDQDGMSRSKLAWVTYCALCAAELRCDLASQDDGAGLTDGGNSSSVQNDLVNVVKIYSTERAFAAIRKDARTHGPAHPNMQPRARACAHA